jgi:hypothetical protein
MCRKSRGHQGVGTAASSAGEAIETVRFGTSMSNSAAPAADLIVFSTVCAQWPQVIPGT